MSRFGERLAGELVDELLCDLEGEVFGVLGLRRTSGIEQLIETKEYVELPITTNLTAGGQNLF